MRMGTVLRSGRRRSKSSAGSAASRRFFGRPPVGGGRTGGRSGDTRFLVTANSGGNEFCFGEAVVSRFPRKQRRQTQESIGTISREELVMAVNRNCHLPDSSARWLLQVR